ncbi:MAG: glycerol-3-phosphate dehydrogenase [Oscillospiraceae bacterium]|nr:glycerol-3-phosphate dehydrogenase [Oscillospiraceae bacterium]
MAKITIIGAGVMGSTLAFPACDNGHSVHIVGTPYDKDTIVRLKQDSLHLGLKRKLPEGISYYQHSEVESVLPNSDLVVAGVSSFGVDWFAEDILPLVESGTPVLIVTKGIYSRGNGEISSFVDYFEEKCDKRVPFYAIGGPCISYELADRHDTFVGICGYDEGNLKKIFDMLTTPYYHINTTTDVVGFEIAAAIKNIYALAVSMAIGVAESRDGLGCRPHFNSQSGLFAQSIREMELIIKCFGGNPVENIVYGVADLYITIESGRNREIGVLLGRGYTVDEALEKLRGMTLESVSAVKALSEALELKAKNGEFDFESVPLFAHVNELMSGQKTVDIPWNLF